MSKLLSTTAVILALTTPVWAQSSMDGKMTNPDRLIGQDVRTTSGQTFGEIQSVIRGPNNEIAGIVVDPDERIGNYGGNVALDWDDVTVDSNGQAVANVTPENLQGMPQSGSMGNTSGNASGMGNGATSDIGESQPGVITGQDAEGAEGVPNVGQGNTGSGSMGSE